MTSELMSNTNAMRLADLAKFSEIVIQCHDNPDADALASETAGVKT